MDELTAFSQLNYISATNVEGEQNDVRVSGERGGEADERVPHARVRRHVLQRPRRSLPHMASRRGRRQHSLARDQS
jgi:hypothetical protein